jgi:hypothetical protein
MPPQRLGRAISPDRVIAVLQGWNVTPAERDAQIQRAEEAGAAGTVVALMKIEQGWEPRILRVPQAGATERGATTGPPHDHHP